MCVYWLLNGYYSPLNPRGRTGLRGRGKLYMWGPNQAADPIVTKTGMVKSSFSYI